MAKAHARTRKKAAPIPHDEWVAGFCGVDPRAYPAAPDQWAAPQAASAPEELTDAYGIPLAFEGGQSIEPAPEPGQSIQPESGAGVDQSWDDGAQPASPLHDAWQEGYGAARANPQASLNAPSPYAEDARFAFAAGVEAALAEVQREAAAIAGPLKGTSVKPDPAASQFGGAPAFRYTLPTIPIYRGTLPSPLGMVTFEMTLTGSVTITFPNTPPGLSTDVGTKAFSLEATKALDGLTGSISVTGLGTPSFAIGGPAGTKYTSQKASFTPPMTLNYKGQVKIDTKVPSALGEVVVSGSAAFELKATLVPDVHVGPRVEVYEPNWGREVAATLVIVGVFVLPKVIAILGAPETGGASLVLLAA